MCFFESQLPHEEFVVQTSSTSQSMSPEEIAELLESVEKHLSAGITCIASEDDDPPGAEAGSFREHLAEFGLPMKVVETFSRAEFLRTEEEFGHMMRNVGSWRGLTNNLFKFNLDERLTWLHSIEHVIHHSSKTSSHHMSSKYILYQLSFF